MFITAMLIDATLQARVRIAPFSGVIQIIVQIAGVPSVRSMYSSLIAYVSLPARTLPCSSIS
jgi:hypothetical protein